MVEADEILQLDAAMKERVRQVAVAQQSTPRRVLRDAVKQYVSRVESRERMIRDSIAAHGKFKATGLQISHEEFEEWVDRLETDPNAKLPECHV